MKFGKGWMISDPTILGVWLLIGFKFILVGKRGSRAPSQYPKRRLSVRSRKISKPRDLYLELSDRSEIWQALRQQCCRCACQISKRYDNWKYQSRGFETLRDLTKRRLFGYWDGAKESMQLSAVITRSNINRYCIHHCSEGGRIGIRSWIYKRHTTPRPNGRAMVCPLWEIWRKLTAV